MAEITATPITANPITAVQVTAAQLGDLTTNGPIYNFNGVDMYATMGTPWVPGGLPFTISGKVKATSIPSLAAYILGADAAANPKLLLVLSPQEYGGTYTDVAAATISPDSNVAPVVGREVSFEMAFTASGVTLTVDGTSATLTPEVPLSSTMTGIEVLGGYQVASALNTWPGTIRDLRFADWSPLQNRTVCVGDKARYITLINGFTLPSTSDYSFEFDWLRQNQAAANTSNTRFFGDAATGTANFLVYDTAHATQANKAQLALSNNDKVQWYADTHFAGVALSQRCRIKMEKVGTSYSLFVDDMNTAVQTVVSASVGDFIVESIGRAGTTLPFGVGAQLGNIRFTDSTLGKEWYYTLEQL